MQAINAQTLTAIYTGFKATFQNGLGMASSEYEKLSLMVTSTTREEEYGWLKKMPGMREWLGERVIHNLSTDKYKIVNKDWEDTVAVDRNDIEDERLGTYAPMFTQFGEAVGAHPNQLVFELLKAGFATPCFDGQYFFDTDHPVLDEGGSEYSVSNFGGGAGTPWYLLCMNRPLKPIIFQSRRDPMLVSLTNMTDANVFFHKQYIYGVDCRRNVGFGLWQLAYGSKQTLDATGFQAAMAAIEGMKGDYGRPLGLTPTHLLVPPSLRSAGQKLLKNQNDAAGASNEWVDTVELWVSPWLA